MQVRNPVILFVAVLLSLFLFIIVTASSDASPTVITALVTPTSTTTPPHCIPTGSIVASPNEPNAGYSVLHGIDAISPTDIWAVGYYWSEITHREGTLIEHWDGTSWTIVPGANVGTLGNRLFSVDAISPNDIWAVGERCPEKSRCYTLTEHWNGTTWSVVPSPNPGQASNYLTAISAVSSTDVWATGMRTFVPREGVTTFILHWDGVSWSAVPNPEIGTENNGFEDIEAISANDVWAVGFYALLNGGVRGMFQHWDGTSWTYIDSPYPGSSIELTGMTALASNDIWAVGLIGQVGRTQPLIEHWDGVAWSIVPSPETTGTYDWLFDVAAVSPDSVWAVGMKDLGQTTLVEHWDGSTWVVANSPNIGNDSALYAVDALPSGEMWAVGGYHADGSPGGTLTESFQSCMLLLPTCPGERFTDVCPTDYFYGYVLALTDDAILSGYNSSPPCPNEYWVPCFNPANSSTRGQITKVVSLAAGFSEPVKYQSFEDVPPGHTFYEFVQRMAGRGIIRGYPCGGAGEPCVPPANRPYLRPGNRVTRGQLAQMVVAAFGWSDPVTGQRFQDVSPGSTFYMDVERLFGRQIINGYPCGGAGEPCGPGNLPYFRPGNDVTRGQTAKIVQLAREEPTSTPTPIPATTTSTQTPIAATATTLATPTEVLSPTPSPSPSPSPSAIARHTR
jgi:hypothetical protein